MVAVSLYSPCLGLGGRTRNVCSNSRGPTPGWMVMTAGPAIFQIVGQPGKVKFEHTFHIAPPEPKQGLYKLTATINHSPTGDPKKLSEMFGYAESTPVDIRKIKEETS